MKRDDETNAEYRTRRAIGMLYAWGEADLSQHRHEHGHPSTSPTYRMMREGMPGTGRSRATGRWRQRIRNRTTSENGQQRYYVDLEPAATCFGSETKSRRMPEWTAPEADAHLMGTPYAVAHVVADMPPDMQAVVYAKHAARQDRMQDVADYIDRPGLDRKACSVLHRNAVEMVAMRLLDVSNRGRDRRIPDLLPA